MHACQLCSQTLSCQELWESGRDKHDFTSHLHMLYVFKRALLSDCRGCRQRTL